MTEKSKAPHRVQLSRAKGWRMPPNTVKVDRATAFGNPFRAGDEVPPNTFWRDGRYFTVSSAQEACILFRHWVTGSCPQGYTRARYPLIIQRRLPELRGKNLACWCALDAPCHADVLLELANAANP